MRGGIKAKLIYFSLNGTYVKEVYIELRVRLHTAGEV